MGQRRKTKPDFGTFRRRPNIAKRKPVEWLAWVTGLIGVCSVGLLLLGYGVALSAEGWGQIPSGSLYGSPAELIALSSIAIARFFDRFSNLEIAWKIALDLLPLGAVEAALAVGIVLLVAWPKGRTVDRAKKLASRMSDRLRGYLSTRTKSSAVINSLVVGAAVLLFIPLAAIIYMWAMLTGAVILSVLPIVGYSMGKIYIDDYVTGPAGCADGTLVNQRLATCLSVKAKELGEYRGRLVYSTSSVLVLYDPTIATTRKTIRIPLAEAVVTAELPPVKADAQRNEKGAKK